MLHLLNFQKILTIKQNNMVEVAVPYPEFFWAYWVYVLFQDLSKSTGEHTVRQTDRPTKVMALFTFFSMPNN